MTRVFIQHAIFYKKLLVCCYLFTLIIHWDMGWGPGCFAYLDVNKTSIKEV